MKTCRDISCNECSVRYSSIFCNSDSSDISLIEAAKSYRLYKKGEILFTEGTPARALLCIRTGKIKISQGGAYGREHIMALAAQGDVLGYRAILDDGIYSSTAIALEDSQVCFIPATVFSDLLKQNNGLALKISILLAAELKEANSKLIATAQQPVKERIAQSLLFMVKYYGFEPDGATINMVITREELANMAGTTRETATRMLYAMRDSGILGLPGKKITVRDIRLLEGLSHAEG